VIGPGRARQGVIYAGGVVGGPVRRIKLGRRPEVPTSWTGLEAEAARVMRPAAFAYVAGSAGLEDTAAANRAAFARHRIVPRPLRDVSERDLGVELFGRRLPAPLVLSPIGALELAHPGADVAVGRAAAAAGLPLIISNQASQPMEEIAEAMGDAPRWFQLYWSTSDELVASLVGRAEACGCEAIVVTLDTTMLGWRPRDLDLGHLPFASGRGIAQYTSDPVFRAMVADRVASAPPRPAQRPRSIRRTGPPTPSAVRALVRMARAWPGDWRANLRSPLPRAAVQTFLDVYSRPSLTWQNLAYLRERTRLPVLLKGVLHPDDARRALDEGADGLVVSNHGGRQVDGAIAALDALPGVVEAVSGRVPVLLDSGVRGGADIFKALALGATAAGIGRPYAYGLAIAGRPGVASVLADLVADFDLTLGLAGQTSAAGLTPDLLVS
jgi:L-lactate dehydrogenase (cytochrome)